LHDVETLKSTFVFVRLVLEHRIEHLKTSVLEFHKVYQTLNSRDSEEIQPLRAIRLWTPESGIFTSDSYISGKGGSYFVDTCPTNV